MILVETHVTLLIGLIKRSVVNNLQGRPVENIVVGVVCLLLGMHSHNECEERDAKNEESRLSHRLSPSGAGSVIQNAARDVIGRDGVTAPRQLHPFFIRWTQLRVAASRC